MNPTIDLATTRRNILLLAISQGLFIVGTSTMIAEAAIVGHALASDKSLATLPVALQQLAVLFTAIPASMLMQRIGRRGGFSLGAGFAVIGTLIAALGVYWGSFPLFCIGVAVNGIYNGFGQFYRFAAVDGSIPAWRGKAISYTLAGGVIAALIGPELAKRTKDLLVYLADAGWPVAPVPFAGSFIALTAVAFVALLVIQFVRIPMPTAEERGGGGRPLSEIMRQPVFIVAVIGGMVGFGGMAFLMTVTPLAMIACGYEFESAAFVIQWHVFAMFAPSFFTGTLIARWGVLNVMKLGAVIFAACVGVNLSGTAVWQFWLGLFLLGLAWNFLYVGASTLVTEAYRPSEKAKVQAANDVLVFSAVSLGALSSGAFHDWVGWASLNLMMGPFVLLTLGALLWLRGRRQVPAAA